LVILKLLNEQYFQESELAQSEIDHLQQVFSEVIKQENQQKSISIHFKKSESLGANALALPSGIIIFTDDIVQMAGSDDELIAVLAHELGHIKHRHVMRMVIQDSLLVFLITFITGDVSSTSSVLLAIPVLLLELGYSRDFEREADRYALRLLQKLGIPTVNFSNVLYRLAHWRGNDEKWPEDEKDELDTAMAESDAETEPEEPEVEKSEIPIYVSSHPHTDERIRLFGQPDLRLAE